MRNIVVGSFVGFVLAIAFLAACGGSSSEANVDELTRQVALLQTEVAALREASIETRATLQRVDEDVGHCTEILEPFHRIDTDVYIEGANLHVRNGLDSTETSNSLGNVIIGYNEFRTGSEEENVRSGSHMLVVGSEHNYSSFGGIVVGEENETSQEYASVCGGYHNAARGYHATVTGGVANIASGNNSSVTGGFMNQAMAPQATVSGGRERDASGEYDWKAGEHWSDE